MKKKHIIASFGVALALAFGAVAGLAGGKEAKAVKADAPESDVTMYVEFSNVSSWWFSDSAVVKVYQTNGTVDSEVSLTLAEKQLYRFTLASGMSQFVVKRFASDGTTLWNQTHDVYYSESFNLVTVKDSKTDNKNEYSVSTLVRFSDSYLYVDAYQSSSYWGNDSAHIYAYFTYGDGQGWSFFEFNAPNAPVSGTNLYVMRISTYADRFVIVRGTEDFAGFVEGWEEKVWNKTSDITFTSSNKECKYVKLGASGEGKSVGVAGFEQVSADSFVDSYCYQFLQFGLCYDAGGLTEEFATLWTAANTAFTSLKSIASSTASVDLKTALKAVDNKEDSNAGRAMKRYDTIQAKNEGVTNFLERAIDQSLATGRIYGAEFFGNNSGITLIIICIAGAAMLSLTFFFICKKKKHQ